MTCPADSVEPTSPLLPLPPLPFPGGGLRGGAGRCGASTANVAEARDHAPLTPKAASRAVSPRLLTPGLSATIRPDSRLRAPRRLSRGASMSASREELIGLVDRYLDALAAHDPSRLPLAGSVKFTENCQTLALGTGRGGACR